MGKGERKEKKKGGPIYLSREGGFVKKVESARGGFKTVANGTLF